MIKFYQVNANQCPENILSKTNGELYCLSINNNTVGFGIIEKTYENPIEIFVYDKFRGNGHGTALFKHMLALANEHKVKETKFVVSNENYIANRIIIRANGKKVSTANNCSVYVLPIENNPYIN